MVAEFVEEMMNMLPAAGADVNSMHGDDETALFKAARLADAAYVTWLLKHGAEPHYVTATDQSALDAAYMAQREGLSDAEDIIDMLEELALESMDTESQADSDVQSPLIDVPHSLDSLDV